MASRQAPRALRGLSATVSRPTATPLFSQLLRSTRQQQQSFQQPPSLARLAHTIPRPPPPRPEPSSSPTPAQPTSSTAPSDPATSGTGSKSEQSRVQTQPHYRLTFTCVPCSNPSTHHVSKQGYHHGSVLITCPHCHNRHVISDHLNIFGDRKVTVEDLMRERGRLVKKGTLGADGNVEFWAESDATKGDDGGAGISGRDVGGRKKEEAIQEETTKGEDA